MNVQRLLFPTKNAVKLYFQRNMGVTSVMFAQASDPIQKLFLDQLHDYVKKSKAQGGMVDVTPDQKKSLEDQLNKLKMQFGGDSNMDMTKFPSFKFTDPKIDPINAEKA